jgi:archaellum component FlaC
MEKQNGKITLDDLAVMIQKGFDNVDDRLKTVNGRFDSIETQLGSLEMSQEDIKLRLTEVAHRFELRELTKRVEKIEKQLTMR